MSEPEQHEQPRGESPPSLSELVAVLVLGAAHVGIELAASVGVSRIYNVAAGVGFSLYLVWRGATTKNLLHVWGIRGDNFWPALGRQLFFGVPAMLGLFLIGLFNDTVPLPWSFWLVCLFYPLFGVAQQFVLQNLVARNLSMLLGNQVSLAFVSALLFSLAHIPRLTLSAFVFVGGFFITLVYRRHPNLWAVGIVHGLLAALVFYVVLRQDPGATIFRFLVGDAW